MSGGVANIAEKILPVVYWFPYKKVENVPQHQTRRERDIARLNVRMRYYIWVAFLNRFSFLPALAGHQLLVLVTR
jgi:hypothetical protein